MRNALGGKPASMGLSAHSAQIAGALLALFAFLTLAFAFSIERVQAAVTGSVKITVVDVSSSQPSNVTLSIKKKGSTSRSSITASGSTITFSVEPGTYVLTNKSSSKYKTWGGDCNSKGEVVIAADAQANCTISNAAPTPTPPPTGGGGGGSTSGTGGRSR